MNSWVKWGLALLLLLTLTTFMLGDRNQATSLQLSFAEFDELIQTPATQISAVELAEYLMQQAHHYNLIDLRLQPNGYVIPTAETHEISSFLQQNIPVNETIILYSEHETTATQLYYLLQIRGYFKVKILTGGMAAWQQQVLYPDANEIPAATQQQRQRITEFFGGSLNSSRIKLPPKVINLEKKIKVHHGC